MKKIDMSSEAITRRLRQTDQLRELSLSLMKAKKESDAKKADLNKKQTGVIMPPPVVSSDKFRK